MLKLYFHLAIALLTTSMFLLPLPGFGENVAKDENPLTAQARIIPYDVESGQIAQVEISVHLPEGYKAYQDQFKLKVINPDGIKVGPLSISPLKEVFDKFSKKNKNVVVKEAKITSAISLEGLNLFGEQKLQMQLTYQACTESYCLFPKNVSLESYIKFKAEKKEEKSSVPLSFSDAQKMGLVWTFLFVFAFGFLTSFTPCVYPMIPITMAILGKEAHARTRWQNFIVSFVYVSGIGVTFSSLGIAAATSGALFGSFMSSPWILGFIVLVFTSMSLSMFGLFELQAPEFLRDGVLSHLKLHGYTGAFVSGLLAGIIASPCVGPVLVGILTYIAQTKNLFLGFWLMFTYAFGMGLIFLAIGFSTNVTKLLPRSGAWMNRIKYFFGSLLLMAALYYLDVLLMSSKVIHQSMATSFTQIFEKPKTGKSEFGVNTIQWLNYSEENIQKSFENKRPVLIDFWADWCAACLELEEKTFSSQSVQLLAANFDMMKFDATQESPELDKLKERFKIIGLPTLIFLDRQGQWIEELTLTEFEDAAAFSERMNKALKR